MYSNRLSADRLSSDSPVLEVKSLPLPRSTPGSPACPHPAAPVAMVTPPAASLTVALVRRRRRGSAAVGRSPSPHARQEGGRFVQRQP